MDAIVRRPRAGVPDRLGVSAGTPTGGHGSRYLVSRNDGSLQQDQWFVADSLQELADGGRLLLDPNRFSTDGTSSLAGYDASRDGRLLAYLVSDGGSDWCTIRVLELDGGEHLEDTVAKVKFSRATWLPDHRSFLYLHFRTEGEGLGTEAAALPGGRLMRHRLGTSQREDELVWECPANPRLMVSPEVSHDGRWLVVHLHEGTAEKNRLWVYPVDTVDGRSEVGAPHMLVDEVYAAFEFVRSDGSVLYLRTDADAPLGKVVRVDLDDFRASGRAGFVDVVPEGDANLHHAVAAGAELLVVRLVDASPQIERFDLAGTSRGVVDVTGGSVLAVRGDVDEQEVLLGLSSVDVPVTCHRLDLGRGTVTALEPMLPAGAEPWTPPRVATERRRATSADGTEVPYFLVRPDHVSFTEPRPTLLYGYGGFNIAVQAEFRAAFAGWLAAGGVLAIANVRGGSEYGAGWHDAGRLQRKQNVFDDYAAVAEHLVTEGVTTPGQLALHGGSNGGLLVGATLTQRPDLAAVALPAVGVLDMLRFHLFTIGAAWTADYGSPDDPEMFETLLAYSPLHNVSEGVEYPATLVLTGDHDDRVVPAHSFKFVAALQHAQAGDAPVVARIETSTGHGLGKPARVVVAESADLLAFAATHTGLDPVDPASRR